MVRSPTYLPRAASPLRKCPRTSAVCRFPFCRSLFPITILFVISLYRRFHSSIHHGKMAENSEIRPPRPHSPANFPAPGFQWEFPGRPTRQFPGKADAAPKPQWNSPGEFPGVSRASGLPGTSVAPYCGGAPRGLIATKSGISPRRRRSGGPQSQVMTRLDAIPAAPRVGAGVRTPESAWGSRYRNSADYARRFFRD